MAGLFFYLIVYWDPLPLVRERLYARMTHDNNHVRYIH